MPPRGRPSRNLRPVASGQIGSDAAFRSLFEFAPDALVIIDPVGRIVLANAQAEKLFGYSREELADQPVEMLLPARFRQSHITHRANYVAEPRARPMGVGLELHGVRRDGREFPVDISLAPLETEEGLLLAAAVRDVSQRRRLETLRDRFIHDAAHELRTPLAAIAAAGDLLAESMTDMAEAQRNRALEVLRRQCERATTLVANLLDLSIIEGGRLELETQPVPLDRVVKHVFDTAPAPEGTTVEVRGVDGVEVVADAARLEQVLTNLVTNTYRYGGRHLRIEATRPEGWIRIAVSDDGPGVPADLIPSLFEPFARGKTAGAVGGSGIGLALCRRLVESFGGEIWYETAEPHGACFVVLFRDPQ